MNLVVCAQHAESFFGMGCDREESFFIFFVITPISGNPSKGDQESKTIFIKYSPDPPPYVQCFIAFVQTPLPSTCGIQPGLALMLAFYSCLDRLLCYGIIELPCMIVYELIESGPSLCLKLTS